VQKLLQFAFTYSFFCYMFVHMYVHTTGRHLHTYIDVFTFLYILSVKDSINRKYINCQYWHF